MSHETEQQAKPQLDMSEVVDFLQQSGLRGDEIAAISTSKMRALEAVNDRIDELRHKLSVLEDKKMDLAQDWKLWTAVFNSVAIANACKACGQGRDYLNVNGNQDESDVAF